MTPNPAEYNTSDLSGPTTEDLATYWAEAPVSAFLQTVNPPYANLTLAARQEGFLGLNPLISRGSSLCNEWHFSCFLLAR